MYKRKSSDKQIDEVIYKAEHDGFGLNEEELDAYMADYPFGNGANPIGTIIAFMGNTPPMGYLACDGSEYDIIDYPKLAKFFKDQFGSTQYFGGTDDKFKVPDLRGEFLRGTGTNSHTDQGSGASVGTHQNATEESFVQIDKTNNAAFLAISNNISNTWTSANIDSAPKRTTPRTVYTLNKTVSTDSYSSDTPYTSRPTNTSVLYCIKADTVTIDELDNTYLLGYDKYSFDEQIVGCWTNGKPLYQKTVEVTIPIVSSDGTFAHIDTMLSSLNVNNIDHIFIEDSHLIYTDTNGTHSLPLTYITNGNFQIKTYIYGNNGNRVIRTISSFSGYSGHKVYVTLRYTKTTDPENSFSITQLSNFKKVTNEANNYSLEEKLIGTWIDDKPVYQKTFYRNTSISVASSTWTDFITTDIPIDTIIDYQGWIRIGEDLVDDIVIKFTNGKIRFLRTSGSANASSSYLTIKYTKTTD